MNRKGPRVALGGLLAFLCGLSPLFAGPPWGAPQLLDPRIPLEIAQLRQDPTDGNVYMAVLFDLPTNALELGRVDMTVDPPAASFIPVAFGAIFALGAAGQAGNQIGFSYIDPAFDVRFGTCALPCNSVSQFPVNIGTWIDSSSAASADDFFVAGLDNNANHGISLFRSTDNGTTWGAPLNTLLPPEPGGVYDNFHGGKRIHLVVDPAATDPATTRNCLLYEVRPSPGTTTAIHLNCRNGATPGFNVIVGTDIPNPSNQFDDLIEDGCVLVNDGGGGFNTNCVYNHRQTGQTRAVRVSQTGVVTGPVNLAPVTGGTGVPGISIQAVGANGEVRVLYPAAGGAPARDITSSAVAGSFVAPGPPAEEGPVALAVNKNPFTDPDNLFLYHFFTWAVSEDEAAEVPLVAGLAVAKQEIPLFADGFDTQNLLRWSTASP